MNIRIASVPDREEVVAEVYSGNNQFAEISQDNNEIRIEFYPKSENEFWNFKFDEIMEALNQAKVHLLGDKNL